MNREVLITSVCVVIMTVLLGIAFTTKEFLVSSVMASFCIIVGAIVSKHLSNLSNNE